MATLRCLPAGGLDKISSIFLLFDIHLDCTSMRHIIVDRVKMYFQCPHPQLVHETKCNTCTGGAILARMIGLLLVRGLLLGSDVSLFGANTNLFSEMY